MFVISSRCRYLHGGQRDAIGKRLVATTSSRWQGSRSSLNMAPIVPRSTTCDCRMTVPHRDLACPRMKGHYDAPHFPMRMLYLPRH
jgi:hypothetical protein